MGAQEAAGAGKEDHPALGVREGFLEEGTSALGLREQGSRGQVGRGSEGAELRCSLGPEPRTSCALCWKRPVVQRPGCCRSLEKPCVEPNSVMRESCAPSFGQFTFLRLGSFRQPLSKFFLSTYFAPGCVLVLKIRCWQYRALSVR